MQFNKKILSLAVCAAASGVSAQWVQAQDTQSTQDVKPLEEVVVKGMRVSLENAQDIKRAADTVMDVITASDIGALPDKSVTEALQRVPGVTINHFASSSDPKHYADEGTGVLVRGLDRVRSEVNGLDAFSANPNGGLSYADFPAELLKAVEVVKNETADRIAGGISGTVNLITRKPFDSDERLISFNAKENYGDFRKETSPSFSALFSDNWDTDAGKFGFLISGTHSEYKTRGDGVGLGNFQSRGVGKLSYDVWGTPTAGVVSGKYSEACIPDAADWRNCDALGFPDAVQYTDEDAANYTPLYEGLPINPDQKKGVTRYTPSQYHISTAENDRERTGFTTSLQWANKDDTIVATLEHINSEAELNWQERRISQAAQGFKDFMASSHTWTGDPENGHPLTFDKNNLLTSGIGKASDVNVPLMYITRWNYNKDTVKDTTFSLALTPTDRLSIDLDFQHIDSEKLVHNYSLSGQTRSPAVAQVLPFFLDLRGDNPTIEYLNDDADFHGWVGPESDNEPAEFIASGMQQEERNSAKANSFKIDVDYQLDGIITAVKAGAYYSDKDLIIRDTEYAGWSPISTPWMDERIASAAATHPELYDTVNMSDYYHGDVIKGNIHNFLFPKLSLVKDYPNTLREGCKAGWSTPGDATGNAADGSGGCAIPYSDMNNRVDGPFAAQDINKTNEKRAEFYLRGDFDIAELAVPIKGNVGLRYVSYKLKSTGYQVMPSTASRGNTQTAAFLKSDYRSIYDLADGTSARNTVDGTDYTTVLPSLNLSFGLTDDLVMRFAASKGIFFPSLTDTRNRAVVSLDVDPTLQDEDKPQDATTNPVTGIDSVSLTASASNPYLEPEESINLDLTAEWYFAPAGSLTVGLFNKKLDNIIRNRQYTLDLEHGGNTYPVSAYGPDNTGSGTIRGFEFSYSQFYDMLPGAWSGLGLQLNFTYIDQNGLEDPNAAVGPSTQFDSAGNQVVDNRNTFRVFSGLPLQGYSDKNFNVVGMYEYEDVSFRLAYTWRSEYLLTTRESEDFAPVFAEPTGMMDASLYYTLNDHVKIGIEGSNLLDTETKTKYQMNQAGLKTDALSFTTDRRYALSIRTTF